VQLEVVKAEGKALADIKQLPETPACTLMFLKDNSMGICRNELIPKINDPTTRVFKM
jgi:hypothetical protein